MEGHVIEIIKSCNRCKQPNPSTYKTCQTCREYMVVAAKKFRETKRENSPPKTPKVKEPKIKKWGVQELLSLLPISEGSMVIETKDVEYTYKISISVERTPIKTTD